MRAEGRETGLNLLKCIASTLAKEYAVYETEYVRKTSRKLAIVK